MATTINVHEVIEFAGADPFAAKGTQANSLVIVQRKLLEMVDFVSEAKCFCQPNANNHSTYTCRRCRLIDMNVTV